MPEEVRPISDSNHQISSHKMAARDPQLPGQAEKVPQEAHMERPWSLTLEGEKMQEESIESLEEGN